MSKVEQGASFPNSQHILAQSVFKDGMEQSDKNGTGLPATEEVGLDSKAGNTSAVHLSKPDYPQRHNAADPTGFVWTATGGDLITHYYGEDFGLSQREYNILPLTDDLFAEEQHPLLDEPNVAGNPVQRNEVPAAAVDYDAPLTCSDVAEETS